MSATPAAHPKTNERGPVLLDFLVRALRGFDSSQPLFPQYWRAFVVSLVPWSLIEILIFAQEISFMLSGAEPTYADPWVWCVRIVMSAALTPFIFWAGARWPLERGVWLRRLGAHILMAVCFSFVRSGIEVGFFYPFTLAGYNPLGMPLEDPSTELLYVMIYGFYSAYLRYWVFLTFQAALLYYGKFQEREREAARLELHASELRAQVAQARLSALKMQLQPHFLFNTLNAIVALVRQGERFQAEQALTQLSDLLRAVLDDHEAQLVPLRRELEYLRLYLAIEQMRFSDRLEVRVAADPELLEIAVPQMILQPIVENAVRHGISRSTAKGTIDIRAFAEGDMLHIVVKDDGPGFDSGTSLRRHGVGLSNLRARLQQLYGAEASLRIESEAARGTEVTLVLPERAHDTLGRDAIAEIASA